MERETIPKRLPCFILRDKTVPFPGTVSRGTVPRSEKLEMFIKDCGVMLIAYRSFAAMYGESYSNREYFGTCAEVVVTKTKNANLSIEVRSIFRARIFNVDNKKSDGYTTAQWEELKDVSPTEKEFYSADFQNDLAHLVVVAIDGLNEKELPFENESFFSRNEEYVPERIGEYIDGIALYLFRNPQEEAMKEYLESIFAETNVSRRLQNIINAYLAFPNKGKTNPVRLSDNEFESVDFSKIPQELPCLTFFDQGKNIPFPGMFGSMTIHPLNKSGKEACEYFKKTPYFVLGIMDPENGERSAVGILTRVHAFDVHENKKIEVTTESLARVDIVPIKKSDIVDVPFVTWKLREEMHLTKEAYADEIFLGGMKNILLLSYGILFFVSGKDKTEVSNLFWNIDEKWNKEVAREDFPNHPERISQFIDESANVLNMFAERPSVYQKMYEIVLEKHVATRMVIVAKILLSLLKELREKEKISGRVSGTSVKAVRMNVLSTDKNDAGSDASETETPLSNGKIIDEKKLSLEAQKMKDFLESNIVGKRGQQRAIRHLVDAYEWYLSPLWRPNAPIFCGLFLGPSGVGKTETARKLGEFIYGDDSAIVKIDCANLQQEHELSKLIGAPPGYVGSDIRPQLAQEKIDAAGIRARIKQIEEKTGKDDENKEALEGEYKNLHDQLIPALESGSRSKWLGARTAEDAEKQPFFSIILFDEIEKADPALFKFLLAILESGIGTLANGEKVSFRHSFIIMTSNEGNREIARTLNSNSSGIGFRTDMTQEEQKINDDALYAMAMEKLKKRFEPEFLGRIQHDIIGFSALTKEEMALVRDKKFDEFTKELEFVFPMRITIKDTVKEFIIKESTDHPEYGVRLLEKKMRHFIELPLSRLINTGQLKEGFHVVMDIEIDGDEEKIVFRFDEGGSLKP